MVKDKSNPRGSDVVATRLRKERSEHKTKRAPKKRRQSVISFEVTSHKPHQKQNVEKELMKKVPTKAKQRTNTSPKWRRIAVWVFIILFVMWYFTNNYMKNVKIEDLQSANEEFAQAYDEQAQKIAELEAQVSRLRGGS